LSFHSPKGPRSKLRFVPSLPSSHSSPTPRALELKQPSPVSLASTDQLQRHHELHHPHGPLRRHRHHLRLRRAQVESILQLVRGRLDAFGQQDHQRSRHLCVRSPPPSAVAYDVEAEADVISSSNGCPARVSSSSKTSFRSVCTSPSRLSRPWVFSSTTRDSSPVRVAADRLSPLHLSDPSVLHLSGHR
jgi:hypothetical protein